MWSNCTKCDVGAAEATASAQRALADYIRIIREEAQKRNAQGDPLLAAQEKYKEKKGYGGKQA